MLEVGRVASAVVRAIGGERREVLLPWRLTAFDVAGRLFPRLAERVVAVTGHQRRGQPMALADGHAVSWAAWPPG